MLRKCNSIGLLDNDKWTCIYSNCFICRIVVTLNVNHTVDADEEEAPVEQDADGKADAVMRSKPNFDVDITKGDTTLCLSCAYLKGAPAENEYGN